MLISAIALAAALFAATPSYDTVFLANGGRVRGTVVEDTPAQVLIQLPDGTYRRFARAEILRVTYGDEAGLAQPPAAPAPSPAPPGPAPQSEPPPPPLPPPPPPTSRPPPRTAPPPTPFAPDEVAPRRRVAQAPPAPPARKPAASTGFQLSLAIEGLGPLGRVSQGGPQLHDLARGEGALALEIGGKPTPGLFLGILVEGAAGKEGHLFAAACQAGGDCIATTGRVGALARFYFTPGGSGTGWLAVGTGVEATNQTAFVRGTTQKLADATASGWEIARVSVGYDWRLSEVLGLGAYLVGSVGTYGKFEGLSAQALAGDRAAHGWLGGGVRAVLFP
jgi:hypothetical protein